MEHKKNFVVHPSVQRDYNEKKIVFTPLVADHKIEHKYDLGTDLNPGVVSGRGQTQSSWY